MNMSVPRIGSGVDRTLISPVTNESNRPSARKKPRYETEDNYSQDFDSESETADVSVDDRSSRMESTYSGNYDYGSDSDQFADEDSGPGRLTGDEPQVESVNSLLPNSKSAESQGHPAEGNTATQSSASSIRNPEPQNEADSEQIRAPQVSETQDQIEGTQKKKAHFQDTPKNEESESDTSARIHEVTKVTRPTEISGSVTSLSSHSGRRHSKGYKPSNQTQNGVRHYTTMSTAEELTRRQRMDSVSMQSSSSRSSCFFSVMDYMTERFIYERDPFESTLKQCPRVTFHVVEKATSPVSIEILFGNTERRALPSYYYTSTEKNSARTKRGLSGRTDSSRRSSSSQSNIAMDTKYMAGMDSPNHANGEYQEDFILKEEETPRKATGKMGNRKTTSAKSTSKSPPREGTLPNIYVSDHSLPPTPNRKTNNKRPITSQSTKTNKSLVLPGKPMKS